LKLDDFTTMVVVAGGAVDEAVPVGLESAVEFADETRFEDEGVGVGVDDDEVPLTWRMSTGQAVASGLAALREEDSAAASSRV